MQLKKIKLAGFKSFVDPTTLSVSSSLVAVVGPNGCGKSNIIDAVCWVMGESSAKYLRGETLDDVIFNGSSTRKPVGQASVELCFDNQQGSLGGEYASYAEISIRRRITREGDSTYFLNGTRVRRRDIIDIFLGTGLGPRSYSIIGQNMIARVIEAKPDEMRIYLEEAAGVSKYKERRRETENRIQRTKENLARLNDLRIELDKQLTSLKRQANAAEKFKTLKQQERDLRSQWLAIQLRELHQQIEQQELDIQKQQTSLAARQTDLISINRQLEQKRTSQRESGETLQEIQRRYYAAGNEITRIEQEIRYITERQRQWEIDIERVNQNELNTSKSLVDAEHQSDALNAEIAQLDPKLNDLISAVKTVKEAVISSEETMQTLQNQWDEYNLRVAKTTQTAQVEQTRIQHLEQRLVSIKQRQVKLAEEQTQINFSQIEQEIDKLAQQADQALAEKNKQDQQIGLIRQQIIDVQTALQRLLTEQNQCRLQLQRLNGQQASLEALQQTALGQRNNRLVEWLAHHKLDKNQRLAQNMTVEKGWEAAVEKVLNHHLQAICVDQLQDVLKVTNELKQGNLCVFATQSSSLAEQQPNSRGELLMNKVKSPWSLASLLSGIYIAQTAQDALAMCHSLAAHESIITREGVWLSASWMRISRDEHPEAGVFQREQELKQLAAQINELTMMQDQFEQDIVGQREQVKRLETQRDQLQKVTQQTAAQMFELQAQQKMQQQRIKEIKSRAERFNQEEQEMIAQLEKTENELKQARVIWQTAIGDLEIYANERDALLTSREEARVKQQFCRQQLNQAQDALHQHQMYLQAVQSKQQSCQQNKERLQSELILLDQTRARLQKEFLATAVVETLQKALEKQLSLRLSIEAELQSARDTLEAIDQALRQFENQRQAIESDITKLRDVLESQRVVSQGLKVKSESLSLQLEEMNVGMEQALEALNPLSENINAQEWYSKLEDISQRITRLGAINLMAIEEFATCSERKDYLDKQNDDLQAGLATLEEAIAKIDKETRARFKETFDKVNERFQALFPQIFGGGHASLVLTGESLLDAGITVMACPPGKRNSTIHLLSGGEKTMTAIALVFSIFHLNPAPFCLLDEVDAPLDDANIGRFCQLVKTMAAKTQFIFISHNKLAIEMASDLMGVTMHEPGVSRLVSVNVEEAVSLAGA